MGKISAIIFGKDIEMPKLDDTIQKYTEQDLFEATQESFKEGYCVGSDSGSEPSKIDNPWILNKHKNWFLSIKNASAFKKK